MLSDAYQSMQRFSLVSLFSYRILKRVCKLKDIAAGLQKFAVIITVGAYHLQKPSG